MGNNTSRKSSIPTAKKEQTKKPEEEEELSLAVKNAIIRLAQSSKEETLELALRAEIVSLQKKHQALRQYLIRILASASKLIDDSERLAGTFKQSINQKGLLNSRTNQPIQTLTEIIYLSLTHAIKLQRAISQEATDWINATQSPK